MLLQKIIVRALLDADHLRLKKYRGHTNKLRGHCYIASECYYHLSPNKKDLVPQTIKVGEEVHWFLKNKKTDKIIDLTSEQYPFKLDYSKARGRGFLTKEPSKRCVALMHIIK